ncbi:MAG: carboxypeptidase regulatory-like domain-containing protein [Fidelibacterota bacterium]|nr:MAG: carboxypeptidase regulatory-like domain-containing protein [Candidatus Neomarinimicrobiota bacterium]
MNKNSRIEYYFFLLLLTFFFFSQLNAKRGNTVEVSGRVLLERNNNVVPVPGLTVYLVSERYGRSVAKITDNRGRFSFREIPRDGIPYYIEVYSNRELLYRRQLDVQSDTEHEVRLR